MNKMDLDSLTYFLDAYWNQMGSDLYGTLANAVVAFRLETKRHRDGLILDLERARKEGLLGDEYDDEIYDSAYWSQFQRCINKSDADLIKYVLRSDV